MTNRTQAVRTSRRQISLVGGVFFLVLLMSWLFFRADAVDIREHQRYSYILRQVRQADAEVDVAVLANRLGLRPDFDAVVATSETLYQAMQSLDPVPSFLNDTYRAKLHEKIGALKEAQRVRMDKLDTFKRENAIFRNSLDYIPLAAKLYLDMDEAPITLRRGVSTLVRDVLAYAYKFVPDGAEELHRRSDVLRSPGGKARNRQEEVLGNLLLHLNVILERKPVLDEATFDILASNNAGSLTNDIITLYSAGYEQALRQAYVYRVILYVLAIFLACGLIIILLRLQRASHDLKQAHGDLQDRFQALTRAQSDLALYGKVFTCINEGILITDHTQCIVAVNPAFTTITGYVLEDVIGRKPNVLSSGWQDEAFYRTLWETLNREGQWRGELWNRRQNGEPYPEWLSISIVRNDKGEITNFIGIFSDISERKSAEARIHHLAHHDALTNLPNRILLQDRLNQTILYARRKNRQAAVLFIDLDRFKPINDSLGQDTGDELLVQVANRLSHTVRDTDTVSRYGGDEFVVLLQDIEQSQGAAMLARKLLSALNEPYCLGQHEITVTASIGIALYPDDGETSAVLLRNADAAMYGAKTERSGLQFYSSAMNTDSIGELLLQNQLRGAVDRHELLLYYQPKVDALTGRLEGAEALLRWMHPELGLLGPNRFVPAAEESGLIVPIGEWVLRTACKQIREWMESGLEPVPVAVNLSAQQLALQDLVELIAEVLQENSLPPCLLQLEITETMLMRDVEHAVRVLASLRQMGVSVSIDDFGSGYSSLTYLKVFAVDVLKIDRSFVKDIDGTEEEGKIATAIIALAHNLGQKVVAEGVETPAQRDFLAEHGCDQFQGYLFGRPEPTDVFGQRLKKHPKNQDVIESS